MDWDISFIIILYKGKGDATDRGNYRDLKITDCPLNFHADPRIFFKTKVKLFKRFLEISWFSYEM